MRMHYIHFPFSNFDGTLPVCHVDVQVANYYIVYSLQSQVQIDIYNSIITVGNNIELVIL